MSDPFRKAYESADAFVAEGPRPLAREVDRPEPFPHEALLALAPAAVAIQEHVQAPAAICAQSVLAAVSLAAQGQADVVLPTGARRPLSLFLITVAASGERKSSVDGLALQAVNEHEERLNRQSANDLVRYSNELDLWKAERSAILAMARGDKPPGDLNERLAALKEPEPPLTPLLICPEPTYEGYCKLTAGGLPALGLFSAEGGQFIGGFGMSAENRLKMAAGLSTGWDGEPIKRVRAGDGVQYLPGRRLSLHLMMQPEVARQLLGDAQLRDQGLLSRLLVSAPPSAAGTRLYRPPSDQARAELVAYRDQLRAMLEARLPLKANTRNELEPRALPLDAEASQMWIAYCDHIESHLGPGGAYEEAAGFANKAPEHAARIAGVLVIWRDINAASVTAEEMAAGIKLANYYLGEAVRLRAESVVATDLRLAQAVLDWLHTKWDHDAVYPAAIYNHGPIRGVRSQAAARAVIKTLEDHGWLSKVDDGAMVDGTHRKEAWRIVKEASA